MLISPKLQSLAVVVALVALGVSTSSAKPASIQDNGAFFSERAKSEAARNIGELERTVRKDLAIETFKELPQEIRQGVNLEDKAAVNRVVEQWALKQARLNGVNGVYILLVKAPAHLQVEVGNDTQKQAFTLRDRDALVSTMLARLRAKQYDEALLDGVSFVSTTMRTHVAGHTRTGSMPMTPLPRAEHSSSGWLIPLLVGLGLVWVVVGIFRAIFRGGGVGSGTTTTMLPTGGTGGGGFFSSLLGGMLGAGAGMWLYDQFSGNRGNSAFGAEPDNRTNGDAGFSGQDTDYSGSGDSFGADSAGGSSGSGDSGEGGDSGAGDSGGGDF